MTDQFGALSNADTNQVDAAGNVVAGVIAGFGIVILVLAVIEVFGGLGVIFGKTFGRAIGIFYSLVFGAILLAGVSGSARASGVTGSDAASGSVVVLLGMFLLYLYSLVVLLIRWRGRARA